MRFFIVVFAIVLYSCSSNGNADQDSANKQIIKKSASNQWLGKWERQQWQNDATLEITNIQSDSIEFLLTAFSGGHIGEIEGMAIVKDTIAIFSNSDESDTCLIEFKLIGDSIIAIDQRQGYCFAGLAVTYDGVYKNSKLMSSAERTESLVTLGVFETEKEDSIFKSLVGESYSLFVNSTQLTSEDEDLDSLNAAVHSSGIRGLFTFMENIIMTDSLNNIWAAVIDDNKVYYFTNGEDYKARLPKTIDNWRQNFKDYEVIFK